MPSARNLRVLVVDDQRSMRGVALHCLTRMKINNVAAVASGKEAVDELNKQKFDVVISDLNMDGMSGLDLLAYMRDNPGLKDIPFLLATSETDKEDAVAEVSSEASGYMAKPFSVAQMREKLETLLGSLT